MRKTSTKDETWLKGSCYDPDTGDHKITFNFTGDINNPHTYYFKSKDEVRAFFNGVQEGSQLGKKGYRTMRVS